MKKVFGFLMTIQTLFGAILLDLTSFEADFTQAIHDESQKVVKYEGHLYAKKPYMAKWIYSKPVEKEVFVEKNSVVVIEPDLEQVVIRKIHDDFDIFELLKSAKEIQKDLYEAHYKDVKFLLEYDGKDIKTLSYTDNFGNNVVITFSNQKYNKKLDDLLFKPDFPDEYDMIIE